MVSRWQKDEVGEGIVAIPQLWTAFVLGWLLVLGFVVWGLAREQLGLSRLVVVLVGLGALAGLYLWLTLRGALAGADLTPAGPGPAIVRRRLLVLGAMAGVVVVLVLVVPPGGVWWLVMYAIVAAGLALPARLAVGVTVLLVGLALASAWIVTGRFESMLLIEVAFGASAIAIRQLTVTVSQLHAAREELAHLAVAEERLRFARDLHDLLGHSLSVIVLKSELAGRLLPVAPERAAAEVGDVERAAREALREVRAAVAGYRRPVLHNELAAARELLSAAGISASVDNQVGALPPAFDGLLAWAVREGVTNVIRHSRARRCTIRVSRLGDLVRAEVTDDGRGADSRPPAHGSGLPGLAERAAAHGGRLSAGPLAGGGFGLVLEAPLDGAAGKGAS